MESKRKGGKGRRAALKVKKGYERLAFGGISDAVRLLFLEEPGLGELENMDLYNVAEIRKPKQGGMEIKFFDRIKALECLERMERQESENGKPSLYAALEESARALQKGDVNGI